MYIYTYIYIYRCVRVYACVCVFTCTEDGSNNVQRNYLIFLEPGSSRLSLGIILDVGTRKGKFYKSNVP